MTVVVGVDSAPNSVLILGRAIEEAELRSAELHVVHVFNPPVAYLEVPIDVSAIRDAERATVWGSLQTIVDTASIPVNKVDLDGYPPDTLAAYATEVSADLLVVGTRGRGGVASLILGSTSQRVLHLASCDVLVVMAGAPEA